MTIKFKKSNPEIGAIAERCNQDAPFYFAVLFHTSDDANILRWEENDLFIFVEFDRHPGDIANQGEKVSHVFAKRDKELLFDMKKMFDSDNDEHPQVTVEKLNMSKITYSANATNMTAKMIVFDGMDNEIFLPEWVTTI